MKQKNYFKLFVAVLGFALFVVSCQKGDVGPAGPAGATGPTGGTGATGPKGDTGTANVIYSAWLDVPFLADTMHSGTVIDTVTYHANITAAKLTNAILNNGEIKVYVNFGTSATPDVVPLPIYDIFYGYTITVDFFLQRIFLLASDNLGTYTNGGLKYRQYRYILIPGSVPGFAGQPVDWNDYNKVKAYLGLKD